MEKIEEGLERKVREKDKQCKKLLSKIEMLEREKRMKEDMDELMDDSDNGILQEKSTNSNNISKEYSS